MVEYTFTRPDGSQLGTQAHCKWLQDCKHPAFPFSTFSLTDNANVDAPGFRQLLNYLYKVCLVFPITLSKPLTYM